MDIFTTTTHHWPNQEQNRWSIIGQGTYFPRHHMVNLDSTLELTWNIIDFIKSISIKQEQKWSKLRSRLLVKPEGISHFYAMQVAPYPRPGCQELQSQPVRPVPPGHQIRVEPVCQNYNLPNIPCKYCPPGCIWYRLHRCLWTGCRGGSGLKQTKTELTLPGKWSGRPTSSGSWSASPIRAAPSPTWTWNWRLWSSMSQYSAPAEPPWHDWYQH